MFEAEKEYEICAEAANGEEVIALAKKHRPDLIILDLAMPVMNGLEAAVELKQVMPEIPIILFTNHAAAFSREIAKAPINVVVSKSDLDLMDHVRTLVPARKAAP